MSNERKKEFDEIIADLKAEIAAGNVSAEDICRQTVTYDDLDALVGDIFAEAEDAKATYLNKELEHLGLKFQYYGNMHNPSPDETDAQYPNFDDDFFPEISIAEGILKEKFGGLKNG